MRFWTVLLTTGLLFASLHSCKKGGSASDAKIEAKQVLDRLAQAMTQKDTRGTAACFATNTLVYGLVGNQALRGSKEVEAYFSKYFSSHPKLAVSVKSREYIGLSHGFHIVAGELDLRLAPGEKIAKTFRVSGSLKTDPDGPHFVNVKIYGPLP